MEEIKKRVREMVVSLNRVDDGLRLFIIKHQHLFNYDTYKIWAAQNQIDEPKANE